MELDEFKIKVVPESENRSETGLEAIEEDAHFSIYPVGPEKNTVSLKEAETFTRQLQSFITLAMSEEVHPKAVIGRKELSGMPPWKDIDILYRTGVDPNNPQSIDYNTENFLLPDIEDRFTEVMSNWFGKYEELRPVFSLYFGTKYNSSMYVENKFLSLSRAIESYHRMGEEGTYLDSDDFDEYYEHLVEDIPDDFDQGFKDHLEQGTFKYANEYSLRKRLELLGEDHEDILGILPIEFLEMKNPITNARNDLTHRETGEKPDTRDLIKYNIILQALLDIILLKEIGISKGQIMEKVAIRYNDRLKQF